MAHRPYNMSYSVAGQSGWDNALSKLLDVELVATENTTASMKGVGQWIWPVALAVVASVALFLFTRRKSR